MLALRTFNYQKDYESIFSEIGSFDELMKYYSKQSTSFWDKLQVIDKEHSIKYFKLFISKIDEFKEESDWAKVLIKLRTIQKYINKLELLIWIEKDAFYTIDIKLINYFEEKVKILTKIRKQKSRKKNYTPKVKKETKKEVIKIIKPKRKKIVAKKEKIEKKQINKEKTNKWRENINISCIDNKTLINIDKVKWKVVNIQNKNPVENEEKSNSNIDSILILLKNKNKNNEWIPFYTIWIKNYIKLLDSWYKPKIEELNDIVKHLKINDLIFLNCSNNKYLWWNYNSIILYSLNKWLWNIIKLKPVNFKYVIRIYNKLPNISKKNFRAKMRHNSELEDFFKTKK